MKKEKKQHKTECMNTSCSFVHHFVLHTLCFCGAQIFALLLCVTLAWTHWVCSTDVLEGTTSNTKKYKEEQLATLRRHLAQANGSPVLPLFVPEFLVLCFLFLLHPPPPMSNCMTLCNSVPCFMPFVIPVTSTVRGFASLSLQRLSSFSFNPSAVE